MNGTQYAKGYIEGGTAQNVEVGFMPSRVRITNLSDTDEVFESTMADGIEFDGGGTGEIKPGHKIQASDAGWSATVAQVIVTGGTWAGGDAAGFIIVVPGSLTGRANVANDDDIRSSGDQIDNPPSGNWATVDNGAGGPLVDPVITLAAAVAASAGAILPYVGSSGSNAVGFSVTTTPGDDGDLMVWEAWGTNNDGGG